MAPKINRMVPKLCLLVYLSSYCNSNSATIAHTPKSASIIDESGSRSECLITNSWSIALKHIRSELIQFIEEGCQHQQDDEIIRIKENRKMVRFSGSSPGNQEDKLIYHIQSEDTGLDDPLQMATNFSMFGKCTEAGKNKVYERYQGVQPHSPNRHTIEERDVIFAAMGFLHNRHTIAQVRNQNLANHIAIFSDSSSGRLFRNGVDISLPVYPYPDLLRFNCNRDFIEKSVYGTPGEKLAIPPLIPAVTDIYFLGSPTSKIRTIIRDMKPLKSWNIEVGQATTKSIHKMTQQERNWTCSTTERRNGKVVATGKDCDCITRSVKTHHSQLAQSKFGLVLKGHSFYSFRLVEVMLSGAIPIIISNGWVMPFHDVLNWDAFSVRLDEQAFIDRPGSVAAKLQGLLLEITPACIDAMRERARYVATQHLSSLRAVSRSIAAILAARQLGCRTKHPTPSSTRNFDGASQFLHFQFNELGLKRNPFRQDVAHGTAAICLPEKYQSGNLKYESLFLETFLKTTSRGAVDVVHGLKGGGQRKCIVRKNNWECNTI